MPSSPVPKRPAALTAAWVALAPGAGCASRGAPEVPFDPCPVVFTRDLGSVRDRVAATGATPDVALAFSPSGDLLAVGTSPGALLLLDATTGEPRWERSYPESVVKRVSFSPDGRRLYAAEQSPTAAVRAMDVETGRELWRFHLSDRLGLGVLPPSDDLWGVYALPTASALIPDGDDVVVVGVRGWDEAGEHRNRSQVLRLNAAGAVVAAFPEAVGEFTLNTGRARDGALALAVGHSSARPAPADAPVGGVWVLDLQTLGVRVSAPIPVLEPWFSSVFVWEALDVAGGDLLAGTGDGRWLRGGVAGWRAEPLGAPVDIAGVPVAASIGFGGAVGAWSVAVTSGTNIPYGAAAPELRPPTGHPGENRVWWDGPSAGSWHGPQELSGFRAAPDGRRFWVVAGARTRDDRRDQFGVLEFEATDRVAMSRFCRTAAPPFFGVDGTADGAIAVVDGPLRQSDGVVVGAHTLTVFGPGR